MSQARPDHIGPPASSLHTLSFRTPYDPCLRFGPRVTATARRHHHLPYKFRFAGRIFRESAKTRSKTLARQAERKRHQSLEEAIHGIKKSAAPVTFATAAADWLKLKKPTLAPKSHQIEQLNIDKHLKQTFGSLLLMDVTADDIAEYQKGRLREGAAPKRSTSSWARCAPFSGGIASGQTCNPT